MVPGRKFPTQFGHSKSGRILLFVATVGFVLTMGISFFNLRKYEELGRIELSETTWVVAQTRYEFLRFTGTLDLYVQPTSTLSKDQLLHRFDILWSRLPLFLEGPESARYAAVPGLQDSVRRLAATLEAMEPRLRDLRKGDLEMYETLRREFDVQAGPLGEVIVSALVQDEGKTIFFNASLERTYLALMIAFAGVLASGTGLIILLLRETAAARRAETSAQAATLQLRVALDSIADGFVLYDQRGRLVLYNDKFVDFCRPAASMIKPGTGFEDILRAQVDAGDIQAALLDPEHWIEQRRSRHYNPVGSFEQSMTCGQWLQISERRTPDGGIVGILTDITELKRRETALREAKEIADQANRAKTAFLATMSHELRTPLNAIIGFSDMIAEEVLGPMGNPRYAEYVEDIRTSGRHLLAIINDILDMAKIESGRLEMSEELFGLEDLIKDTFRLLRAGAAGIELSLEPCAESLLVLCDQQLIRQILLNLYSNALKFTPPGGMVRTRIDRGTDGSAQVRISDTGIGIAREYLAQVMQPFVQLESHLHRRHDGTGLGLPLVKAMVELHGGRFELDSEPGTGTTATVIIPACRTFGTKPSRPQASRPAASLTHSSKDPLHDEFAPP